MIGRDQIVLLTSETKEGVLRELVAAAATHENVGDADALYNAVAERERQYTTAIGLGIAVPHARVDAVRDYVIAFGRSTVPLDFDALDELPVSIFVLIAVESGRHKDYIRILSRTARFLKDESNRTAILEARDADEIAEILDRM